jgi:hypothetical protein
MPRQSVSAENNPGEKVMMRKLAIAVFALSLTALGCGSDSGSPAPDGGHAGDSAVTPGAEAGAPKDVASTPDAAAPADGPGVDVAAQADAAAPSDVAQTVDAGQVTEAGNLDVPSTVDGGPRIDGGAVDSNTPDVAAAHDVSPVDAGEGEAGLAADSGTTG